MVGALSFVVLPLLAPVYVGWAYAKVRRVQKGPPISMAVAVGLVVMVWAILFVGGMGRGYVDAWETAWTSGRYFALADFAVSITG